jgi:hypothetical protein
MQRGIEKHWGIRYQAQLGEATAGGVQGTPPPPKHALVSFSTHKGVGAIGGNHDGIPVVKCIFACYLLLREHRVCVSSLSQKRRHL